jgi:hypothetical protein
LTALFTATLSSPARVLRSRSSFAASLPLVAEGPPEAPVAIWTNPT